MILLAIMKQERRYRRFLIEGMDVKCRIFFNTEVKIHNISLGGVAFSLNKRLNMGQKYALKIESGSSTISLEGIVVWAKIASLTKEFKGKKLPIYEVGMSFNEMLTGKAADLLNFIDRSHSTLE